MTRRKLGHIDSKPDARDCRLAAFLPGLRAKGLLPPLLPTFGHGNDFAGEGWLMLGNGPEEPGSGIPPAWAAAKGGAGDCEVAGPMHEIMADASNAGRPVPRFNGRVAIETYQELTRIQNGTAYDPATGEGDTGLETRLVLDHRQKVGVRDADGGVHKIGDYLFLEPKNLEELFYAIWLLERACIAIDFPESADADFANGSPWRYDPASPIVGGHYVFGSGRPDSANIAFITWARRTLMTLAFYQHLNSETATYVDVEQFRVRTGRDWEGHSAEDLEKYLHLVAAKKAVLF